MEIKKLISFTSSNKELYEAGVVKKKNIKNPVTQLICNSFEIKGCNVIASTELEPGIYELIFNEKT